MPFLFAINHADIDVRAKHSGTEYRDSQACVFAERRGSPPVMSTGLLGMLTGVQIMVPDDGLDRLGQRL